MYTIKHNNTGLLIHADMLEQGALDKINLLVNHPAFKDLIAIMPDAHDGKGCVVGFTGRLGQGVIPNVVGVDIGCGVRTYRLGKFPIDFGELDSYIRANIPLGFSSRNSTDIIPEGLLTITEAEQFLKDRNLPGSPVRQLGTLGGGNHFIEIEQSTDGTLYLTIHTGSRNFGKQVAEYYQRMAKKLCTEMNLDVPEDLEYLPKSFGGLEYMVNLRLAQDYAALNRQMILLKILEFFDITFQTDHVCESVHNYIDNNGFIRKGAISAKTGEQLVIPLNMGDGIVIGTGKGNSRYNFSAPHGAGRVAGRKEMFRRLKKGDHTMEEYKRVMGHVFSTSVTEDTFDESPMAYKPYATIEKHLKKTINITEIIRPVYNIKAGGD